MSGVGFGVRRWALVGNLGGTIDREAAVWLRFYSREGNLVPLPEEAAQQVQEAEQQQAQQQELNNGLSRNVNNALLAAHFEKGV